jgi:hypothetical protein
MEYSVVFVNRIALFLGEVSGTGNIKHGVYAEKFTFQLKIRLLRPKRWLFGPISK